MKRLVKLIFTTLMPIGMLLLTISAYQNGYNIMTLVLLTVFSLFTILQSFMWFIFLDKVNIIPKITMELYFGIGLVVSYKYKQFVLTIPFVIIVFDWKKRVKKTDFYGNYY